MIVIQKVQLNFIYISERRAFTDTFHFISYLANRLQIKLFKFKRWQSSMVKIFAMQSSKRDGGDLTLTMTTTMTMIVMD